MLYSERDIYFIKKTFLLAKKAKGFTTPNPLVGALIVKNDKIISKGYHKRSGLPHAEIEAIRKTTLRDMKGSTLYINLEPCYHFGKTSPCVDEIIKNKFKRVVVSTVDPNPKVKGKSIKKLRNSGVEVSLGVLEKEARQLNEHFFKNMEKNSPFVAAKTAQSLDGKIASRTGLSKWITSKKTRDFAKSLRDEYDCILVGINTVIKDNPHLDGLKKIPVKIIIDPKFRLPLNSNLANKYPEKLIIFTSYRDKNMDNLLPFNSGSWPVLEISSRNNNSSLLVKAGLAKWNNLIIRGAKVFFLREEERGLPINKILRVLYDLGLMSVFIEGGAETIGRFFDDQLVDKVYTFIAPKIIGGRSAIASVAGIGNNEVQSIRYLNNVRVKKIGQDIFISGYTGI